MTARPSDFAEQVSHPPLLDPPIKECPHCGSDQFFIRYRVSGTMLEHHRFDGIITDNAGMWDTVNTRNQKRAYCSDCQKPIAKVLRA